MRAFLVSLYSEFYKSRKTLAFWSAILLPFVICILITWGFLSNHERVMNDPGMVLWLRYASAVVGVMGVLLLPILVIYNTYAITNIEYKGDTWKTLFALPLPKFAIYSSKFIYIVFLTFLTLFLFVIFMLGTGYIAGLIQPKLKFHDFQAFPFLSRVFLRLFFSSLAIISIQFLMNLIWNDFLKPFGIGFLALIMGIITANLNWKYVDFIPYAYPNLAVKELTNANPKALDQIQIFDDLSLYSSLVALGIFVIGYFIIARKAIK